VVYTPCRECIHKRVCRAYLDAQGLLDYNLRVKLLEVFRYLLKKKEVFLEVDVEPCKYFKHEPIEGIKPIEKQKGE